MKINNLKTIVFTTIDELNQNLIQEDQLGKSLETRLFGGNSKLDSLGLVNLIVAVEQNIEDEFDITITLADERSMSQKHSPFRTVGSLVDYIEMLLKEKLND
jgi:acyl carrier protein